MKKSSFPNEERTRRVYSDNSISDGVTTHSITSNALSSSWLRLYHQLRIKDVLSWSSSSAGMYAFWRKSSQITEKVPAVEVSLSLAVYFLLNKKERLNNHSSWYQWGWRSSKNHLLSSACCWQPSFFFCLASAESCWLPVKVKCRTRTVQQHADCQHACKSRHNSRRQEALWWAYGTQIEAL